jgi:sugar lactone lactonase YvrE
VRPEQLTDAVAYHAEGPVWAPEWGGLRWLDMFAGDLLGLDAATGAVSRVHLSDLLAAVRPATDGSIVAGVARGFARFRLGADGSVSGGPIGTPLWTDPVVRMNEGSCDPQGRFWCGSYSQDRAPNGALYRLSSDGDVRVCVTGITVSNGLDWSPDGRTAFYIDSAHRRVDRFDVDEDGELVERRVFTDTPVDGGSPDGLVVDADGGVWVAFYGGGCVRRYRPDGVLDRTVAVPVSRVTACTLGGERLVELFITTSREHATDP